MYEICFIDDTIPAASLQILNDRERLNKSNLKLLLKDGVSWSEAEVRSLVDSLLSDETTWKVSAFIHPEFYLNHVEKEDYRPDIIIYDWEYAGGSGDPATTLLEILQTTFVIVYIYSGADHETQIQSALEGTELRQYKDKRLFVLTKEADSHKKLIEDAKVAYEKNFSFRFGNCLRKATIKALDRILVDLGSHDIDFVTRLLSEVETKETDVKGFIVEKLRHYLLESGSLQDTLRKIEKFDDTSINEFVTFLASKMTDIINSIEFEGHLQPSTQKYEEDSGISMRLWAQRIYYLPSDNIVRRGDIVQERSTNRCYLVITADCDLARFWDKNFGFINVIPLYNCLHDSQAIKNKMLITRKEDQLKNTIAKIRPKSLTGRIEGFSEGPFICPFLGNRGESQEYIGFPKEITSIKIEAPVLPEGAHPGGRKSVRLLYSHWEGYDRIATISEPFLTALVQHCINSISGCGTPDYTPIVIQVLNDGLKGSLLGGK